MQTSILRKTLAFWLVFLALYLMYRFFPLAILTPLAGVTESNFQHYKAAFFCYMIISGLEWLRLPPARRTSAVLYARLTAAVFLPWIIFLLWYLAPALIGRWPNPGLEVLWANTIILVSGACAVILERSLEGMAYPRSLRAIILGLVAVSALIYIIFTYKLPWADVFVEPNWH